MIAFNAKRRRLLLGSLLPLASGCLGGGARDIAAVFERRQVARAPLFDDLARRTFDFFWETTPASNGLSPDRYPTPSFSSIAAVGFALTAYPIGVERGYITRLQAIERVLATVRFFRDAPQGPGATGTAGYKGFFYHFLDMKTGTRFGDIELSTVDTALLMGGMLFCRSYFDRGSADEAEIRRLVDEIYARIDWPWMQVRGAAICVRACHRHTLLSRLEET